MVNKSIEELLRSDKKRIWHPFTQMGDWVRDDPSRPIVIEKGRGAYLWDKRGNKYIDGISSLWVTVHGHGKREIDAAISSQAKKISHTTFLGLTHEPAILLAEILLKIAPGNLSRVFYSDNGSTSVEVALKMAYQYHVQKNRSAKRDVFISLENAYHGDTIGSVSVGGMGLFHSKFSPLLFEAKHIPSPYCYRCRHRKLAVPGGRAEDFKDHTAKTGCGGECLKEAADTFKKYGKRTAALVMEPLIQGAAGMLTFPTGYTKALERLCRQHGVLLICDEVATGFGRTGKMFAVEHEGVEPDFLCVAKGMTGGYLPLAATITTERVYGAFLGRYEDFKTFFHGHTYTANPLACAAAIANLELFKTENTLRTLGPKIKYFKKRLDEFNEHPNVGNVRQLGLMAGIELVKNRETAEDYPANQKIGARVCAAARRYGLMIRPLGNVLVLMPPLAIKVKELEKMFEAVRFSMEDTL
ncbi:MAG: adenosylmethionine--8-amino-7-oxononanoate transaminase [Endomicrobiales bacterium]|nr:adenosylmethionine--8-amino-7-oxononanoate transaminase [Endomicrobiales bacterium]